MPDDFFIEILDGKIPSCARKADSYSAERAIRTICVLPSNSATVTSTNDATSGDKSLARNDTIESC
jgi:hypothetical protein